MSESFHENFSFSGPVVLERKICKALPYIKKNVKTVYLIVALPDSLGP
jgi:hypothetical protein